jgi:2-iminobutanoate/2-iminopropanoate deaminase
MKTIINTKNAPAPLGAYNQAILAGGILYIS